MTSFDNQFNFRVDNQLKILFALRNGPLSLHELANKINVSFTAITNIISQLVDESVVVYTKKQKSGNKGRIPSYVKINNKVGVTCGIDFSSDEVTVAISDLRSRILVKKSISTDFFITEDILADVANAIKELLLDKVIQDRSLLSICISTPGLINKASGEIINSFRLQKLGNLSLSTYFFNIFGVHCYLYNDVKIGLIGERMFGSIPPDAKNYMFIHLGNGCSSALTFDGKLYQGTNGYSGELSCFKNNDWYNPVHRNNHLEGLAHIAARIYNKNPKLNFTISQFLCNDSEIIKHYELKNPDVLSAIEESAKNNAIQLIAYNDVLDLEYIIISGTILKLGNYYKELLVKYIEENDTTPFRAKLLFSSLDSPSLYGAIYQANNTYFLRKLEQIANKKAPKNNYDISEAFGFNI